jgi:membrane protein implicated in regulation of membrane protease activity
VGAFVVLGVVGLLVVAVSAVLGDALDGVLEAVDLGGWLSVPAVGGFLAAFGLAGAVAEPAIGPGGAAAVGTGAGAAVGVAVGGLTRWLARIRTDPTPRPTDLVGLIGVLLLPVHRNRLGRVRIAAHGQQFHLSARADEDIPAGTQVVVVQVVSPTAVVVTPTGLNPEGHLT